MEISGTTKVVGLIGYPARYSLSPALQNAAFNALGVDYVYAVFPVHGDQLGDGIRGIKALDIAAVSVTVPHKTSVIPFLDDVSDTANVLQAVNWVMRNGDHLSGDNTDVAGFGAAMHASGVEISGRRCVVLGAGGAARAVVYALVKAGASDVAVINRTQQRALDAAANAGHPARVGSLGDVAMADLVINATSVGMIGGPDPGGLPTAAENLHGSQTVVDLVYEPRETPFMTEARRRGASVHGGIDMLVYQAAEQVRSLTGMDPPIEVMRKALLPLPDRGH